MSNTKMLIDATHPEETRVVVLRNGRVEEFDYESAARKLLRGNIYLAKVTRVEPSLQAAFVDYGGNRHGFLAFNEIHPDYYQIPMADRQALLDEEAAEEAREEAEADARAERLERRQRQRQQQAPASAAASQDSEAGEESDAAGAGEPEFVEEPEADEGESDETPETIAEATTNDADLISEPVENDEDQPDDAASDVPSDSAEADAGDDVADASASSAPNADDTVNGEGGVVMVAPTPAGPEALEQTGAEDALEELPSRPRRHRRSYKIQEVIKRRQVILVQVVKEERGNKGAALTTYLSLAGRYTVLMPNTARGGGISRKITNPQDRKRLKAIANELEVPEGMGLIIRTAGAARTKQEIKRDFEYLLRLWESVRDLTLSSSAPNLVYEEGDLIKRSIRDLYNKDVEEIVVAGDHAFRDAKDFMRMLMPSHTKNVIEHRELEPLFTRYGIERQLNAMFNPHVTLRSGGYLVINQTEALVAIDVNSGKATREFSIEETALNTNLEAADEIARQLKLRDLAGLVVIDFIDMEEKRNNRAVERRLKDALRFDRARIQLGHISHFGLMEMSRQRLRSGVLEGSTSQCPHCQGTGIIRSTESVALAVLRGLEDALLAGPRTSLVATTTAQVALYILNNKRAFINDMEARHSITVTVQSSDKLQGANFTIEKGAAAAQPVRRPDRAAVNMHWGFTDEAEPAVEEIDEAPEQARSADADGGREFDDKDNGEDGGGRRGRRRRGRRGNRDRDRGERSDRSPDRGDHRRGPMEAGRRDGFRADHPREREVFEEGGSEPEFADLPAAEFADSPIGGDSVEEGADGRQFGAERPERGDREGGRRRRRGRRGGRRGRDRTNGHGPSADNGAFGDGPETDFAAAAPDDNGDDLETSQEAAAAVAEPRAPAPRREPVEVGPAAIVADKPAPAAPVVEAKPAPVPRRARNPSTASEPKLERVVVRPDQPVEGASGDATEQTSAPVRKGWWQRTLGG